MHVFTHLKKESEGKTGLGLYPDGMVEHDGHVGQLLKKLDDLGIADNTIVVYTTDNGAEVFTWPDGGTTPFKGEKATNWEGAFRVPTLIRWPGVIKPGTVINDICAHEDLIPTFAAAAGEPDLVNKVKQGYKAGGKTFKVHLDGYNLMPFLKGEVKESPRKEFIYWSDDGDLMAIRYEQWKAAFLEQHAEISPKTPVGVWQGQFTKLRLPNFYNLRTDPFERGPTSIYYGDWMAHRAFVQVPMQGFAAKWLESFKEFPPRQKPASFNLDEVMRKMSEPQDGKQVTCIPGRTVEKVTHARHHGEHDTCERSTLLPNACSRSACALAGCSAASRRPRIPKPADPHGWIGTETVKTRFGDFEFKNGYPTPAAADALLDQLKFNRAIEVYLTQMPAVAIIEIAARAPRLRREELQSGRHLGTAHGRRDARAHGEHRDGVRHGLPRPEGRRPDRRRSAAEDARRRDGHAPALPRGHRPARAGQGQGRQVPVPPAGIQGRRAGGLLRRQVADLQRQLTSSAASRWTGRPTRPWR